MKCAEEWQRQKERDRKKGQDWERKSERELSAKGGLFNSVSVEERVEWNAGLSVTARLQWPPDRSQHRIRGASKLARGASFACFLQLNLQRFMARLMGSVVHRRLFMRHTCPRQHFQQKEVYMCLGLSGGCESPMGGIQVKGFIQNKVTL